MSFLRQSEIIATKIDDEQRNANRTAELPCRQGPPTLPLCRSIVTVEDESRRRGHDLAAERPPGTARPVPRSSRLSTTSSGTCADLRRWATLACRGIEATTERPLVEALDQSLGSEKRPLRPLEGVRRAQHRR